MSNNTNRPTDEEILVYEQSIKDQVSNSVPLVAEPPLELSKLKEEYSDNPPFLEKIQQLEQVHGFKKFRKCRGDGNCFYRAFAYLYFEYMLLKASDEEYQAALKLFPETKSWLLAIGYQEYAFEDFFDVTFTYLSNFRGCASSELSGLFQTDDQSNAIVVYFRLITSAYLQKNADDYFPYVVGDGAMPVQSMAEFCHGYVEAFGRDADQIHIIALAKAMGLLVRIAYLNASSSVFTGSAESDSSNVVSLYSFAEDCQDNGWMNFLYRPGHYDILYRE